MSLVEPKAEPTSSEFIMLKIVSQTGAEVHFKIKPGTPMRKLMEAYCNRQSCRIDSIRFLFNGERVNETQTAAEIGLKTDDVIDAVVMQVGGAQ